MPDLLREEGAVLVDWQICLIRAAIHLPKVQVAVLDVLLFGEQVALEALALRNELLPLLWR